MKINTAMLLAAAIAAAGDMPGERRPSPIMPAPERMERRTKRDVRADRRRAIEKKTRKQQRRRK